MLDIETIFDHLSRKNVIMNKVLQKHNRRKPYIQVLKFGFNLIMIAVVEFSVIYLQDEETDLTKPFLHFPFLQCFIVF